MQNSRIVLASVLAAVLTSTLLAHWLQFDFSKIPLPLERTSLFIVPLATLILGAILAVFPSNRIERAVRSTAIAAFCFTSLYFVGELRDSHFRAWQGNADVKDTFPLILDRCRRAGIHEIVADYDYEPIFTFYRALYHADDQIAFTDLAHGLPPGRPFYVLSEKRYGDFIRAQGLQIVYHGPTTDLVVAVRPEALSN